MDSAFPLDIYVRLVSYLKPSDFLSVVLLSRAIRDRIYDSNLLWKSLCYRHLSENPHDPFEATMKEYSLTWRELFWQIWKSGAWYYKFSGAGQQRLAVETFVVGRRYIKSIFIDDANCFHILTRRKFPDLSVKDHQWVQRYILNMPNFGISRDLPALTCSAADLKSLCTHLDRVLCLGVFSFSCFTTNRDFDIIIPSLRTRDLLKPVYISKASQTKYTHSNSDQEITSDVDREYFEVESFDLQRPVTIKNSSPLQVTVGYNGGGSHSSLKSLTLKPSSKASGNYPF